MNDKWEDLNWRQFEEITCNLSPEFVTIYQEFETELPKLLQSLQEAMTASSFQQVAALAHQIKGSASNFGFFRTSQEMNALEQKAQKKLLQHAKQHLIAAQEAFERAKLEINRHL